MQPVNFSQRQWSGLLKKDLPTAILFGSMICYMVTREYGWNPGCGDEGSRSSSLTGFFFFYRVLSKKSINCQESILCFSGTFCHRMVICSIPLCFHLSSSSFPVLQFSQLLAWMWSFFCSEFPKTRFLFSWFQEKKKVFQNCVFQSFTHKLAAFVTAKECLKRYVLIHNSQMVWFLKSALRNILQSLINIPFTCCGTTDSTRMKMRWNIL